MQERYNRPGDSAPCSRRAGDQRPFSRGVLRTTGECDGVRGRENVLGRKARPAATGLRGVGVFESKAARIQAIVVVNRRPHEVQTMPLVHVDGDSLDLKLAVLVSLFVETEDIAHPRTTAALHAHAEPVTVRDVFLADDFPDLLRGVGADLDRRVLGFRVGGRIRHRKETRVCRKLLMTSPQRPGEDGCSALQAGLGGHVTEYAFA